MALKAKSLDQCLKATFVQHRIERDENTLACFKQQKAFIGSDACFTKVRQIKAAQQSSNLSETLKQFCFYEASIFQSMKTCLLRSSEFSYADNHDEAVFDCYKQFQDRLTKKQCIEASNKLIYPAKKSHLLQQCYNNHN